MKRINFERIEIFEDIEHTRCRVCNVKKDFANAIYQNGLGIESHALALKIYNSSGEAEFSEPEVELIKKYAAQCQPAFYDAIIKITK